MTSKSSQKSGSHASGGYQYSMSLGANSLRFLSPNKENSSHPQKTEIEKKI